MYGLLKRVEVAQHQIKIALQTNFDNNKHWIKFSACQENYIFEVFYDYLVPLTKEHKIEEIVQVWQYVTVYQLELLDPLDDGVTKVQASDGSQGGEKIVDDANS